MRTPRRAPVVVGLGVGLSLGCNRAPVTWPDDAIAPGAIAPWYHPSDEACENGHDDEPLVVIDGYRYCSSVSAAYSRILPIDDPVHVPCSAISSVENRDVVAIFDGYRARAYVLQEMEYREIVHLDWDGVPILLTYCPLVGGGNVFERQTLEGDIVRYNVAGLWGSANTLVPRHELFKGNEPTVYTTWDGHALFGAGRPGALDEFPVLIDYLSMQAFVARYGQLGDTCEAWVGEEELGIGCEEACARYTGLCPLTDPLQCANACTQIPRSITDCMQIAPTCALARFCQRSLQD